MFDRDGTLNLDPEGYTYQLQDLNLTRFALNLGSIFETLPFSAAIVTNQSGIGRGIFTECDFIRFTAALVDLLDPLKMHFFAYSYCPHTPEFGCSCRKPGIFLLKDVLEIRKFSRILFVGNSQSDWSAAMKVEVEYLDSNLPTAHFMLKNWLNSTT
jgi:D-glycero-D-manno-heptose 1,7-bisphosphate phosphatase